MIGEMQTSGRITGLSYIWPCRNHGPSVRNDILHDIFSLTSTPYKQEKLKINYIHFIMVMKTRIQNKITTSSSIRSRIPYCTTDDLSLPHGLSGTKAKWVSDKLKFSRLFSKEKSETLQVRLRDIVPLIRGDYGVFISILIKYR